MRFPPVSRWIFVFIRKKTGEAGLFSQRVDKPRPCHSEEYPKGTCFAARNNVGIHFSFWEGTDSHASDAVTGSE